MKEEWCRLKCLIKSSKHQTFFSPIFALSASFVEISWYPCRRTWTCFTHERNEDIWCVCASFNVKYMVCVCLSFLLSFLSSLENSMVPIYDFLYWTIFQGNSRLLAWNVIEIKFILSFWKGLFSIEHVLFLRNKANGHSRE